MAPANKGFEVSWILILTIAITIAIIMAAILIFYKVQTGGSSAGEGIKDALCVFKIGGC